jgi:hypothetical protein
LATVAALELLNVKENFYLKQELAIYYGFFWDWCGTRPELKDKMMREHALAHLGQYLTTQRSLNARGKCSGGLLRIAPQRAPKRRIKAFLISEFQLKTCCFGKLRIHW